jgi:serine phosphatase RsbU (regulator of sigma subunit)
MSEGRPQKQESYHARRHVPLAARTVAGLFSTVALTDRVNPRASFDQRKTHGEVLVVSPDGFTEAMKEEFGEERLLDARARHQDKSASEIVARLGVDVRAFPGDRVRQDDMTIVVLKVT